MFNVGGAITWPPRYATLGVGSLPRMKPTSVNEQRFTLGNFERKWVVEQEDYLKTRLNVATIGVAVIPVAAIGGLGLLGYGIYRGLNSMSFGDALDTATSFTKVTSVVLNRVLNPFYVFTDQAKGKEKSGGGGGDF